MRRKTGKKPEVIVVEVEEQESKEGDKDDIEMESEDETTLSENDDQGRTKEMINSVERSLSKGLSDIVDMCEGRLELDYEDEDLEEGKDYEKELWEAFEELEALNNNREVKKTIKEKTLPTKTLPTKTLPTKTLPTKTLPNKPAVAVPSKESPLGLAMKKLQDFKTSQEKTGNETSPTQSQSVARTKPSFEQVERKTTIDKMVAPQEVRKDDDGLPWYQKGIFFVCGSFINDRACGRRCNGRRLFKEHLTRGGFHLQKFLSFSTLFFCLSSSKIISFFFSRQIMGLRLGPI